MRKRLLTAVCIFVFALAAFHTNPVSAQINIGGISVSCTFSNGAPVQWHAAPNLNDVGKLTGTASITTPTGLLKCRSSSSFSGWGMSVHMRTFRRRLRRMQIAGQLKRGLPKVGSIQATQMILPG